MVFESPSPCHSVLTTETAPAEGNRKHLDSSVSFIKELLHQPHRTQPSHPPATAVFLHAGNIFTCRKEAISPLIIFHCYSARWEILILLWCETLPSVLPQKTRRSLPTSKIFGPKITTQRIFCCKWNRMVTSELCLCRNKASWNSFLSVFRSHNEIFQGWNNLAK